MGLGPRVRAGVRVGVGAKVGIRATATARARVCTSLLPKPTRSPGARTALSTRSPLTWEPLAESLSTSVQASAFASYSSRACIREPLDGLPDMAKAVAPGVPLTVTYDAGFSLTLTPTLTLTLTLAYARRSRLSCSCKRWGYI